MVTWSVRSHRNEDSPMSHWTRIDVWTFGEYCDFMEWAAKQDPPPKTKEDMKRLLSEYRKADIMVEGHKEQVEHMIHEGIRTGQIKPPKKGDEK